MTKLTQQMEPRRIILSLLRVRNAGTAPACLCAAHVFASSSTQQTRFPMTRERCPVFSSAVGLLGAGSSECAGHDFRTLGGSHVDGKQAMELFQRTPTCAFCDAPQRCSTGSVDNLPQHQASSEEAAARFWVWWSNCWSLLPTLCPSCERFRRGVPLRGSALWRRKRLRTGKDNHQRTCVLQGFHGGVDIQWRWCVDTWRDTYVNHTRPLHVR